MPDDSDFDISDEIVENVLLPVYHQVLHDPAQYDRLMSILDNVENDIQSAAGATLLLYLPSHIRALRGKSSPNEDYIVPMASITRKIVSDRKIMVS